MAVDILIYTKWEINIEEHEVLIHTEHMQF